eukprot:TRINITY_DN114177_c0_g1_i1.p1 TRINITY_DN114177_c0_g1~~TRINITY_DN114177_c0_g1_i1.p1  ORF type:complete len:148 (+),score=25.83 TRINITY_DN114177_c0_g1_i1:38-481(+)
MLAARCAYVKVPFLVAILTGSRELQVQAVGGLSVARPAGDDIKAMIHPFLSASLRYAKDLGWKDPTGELDKGFTHYEAISFKSQLVAGTNYFIKVRGTATDYFHMRVFKPLPHENKKPELVGIIIGETAHSEIQYFSPPEGHTIGEL